MSRRNLGVLWPNRTNRGSEVRAIVIKQYGGPEVLASALVTGTSEFPLSEIPFEAIVGRVAEGTYKAVGGAHFLGRAATIPFHNPSTRSLT